MLYYWRFEDDFDNLGALFYSMKTKSMFFLASPCSAALATHSTAPASAAT